MVTLARAKLSLSMAFTSQGHCVCFNTLSLEKEARGGVKDEVTVLSRGHWVERCWCRKRQQNVSYMDEWTDGHLDIGMC